MIVIVREHSAPPPANNSELTESDVADSAVELRSF